MPELSASHLAKARGARRPPWLERAGVGLLRLGVGVLRRLPEHFVRTMARAQGRAVYLLGGPDFLGVRRNLRIAFRDFDDEAVCGLARRYWVHLFTSLADAVYLERWTRENVREHVDLSELEKLEPYRGRGLIFASGHIGSWEVGPYALALAGVPFKLLHEPGTVRAFFEYVDRERSRSGMEVLSKLSHPWALKRQLDRGAWLCIACDINATRRGDQVPFFGTLCSSYLSAAALQQAAKCPIAVATTARLPDGRHKLRVWRIVEYRPGAERADLRRTTWEIHRALEEAIRAHPEQWFWHYPRWRSRPANEAGFGPEGLPPLAQGDWWQTIDWEAWQGPWETRERRPWDRKRKEEEPNPSDIRKER